MNTTDFKKEKKIVETDLIKTLPIKIIYYFLARAYRIISRHCSSANIINRNP
jgi:hypothetical protein